MGHTWEEPFYEYKIHIVYCADSKLSVYIATPPGNVHDSTQYMYLMKRAISYGTEVLYMIADTAYETTRIISINGEISYRFCCAIQSPKREETVRLWNSKALLFQNSTFEVTLQTQNSYKESEQHRRKGIKAGTSAAQGIESGNILDIHHLHNTAGS